MNCLAWHNDSFKPSQIGFGCLALGGHGVGSVDLVKLEEAFNFALESGVNFFDTADIYGLGVSEEVLGKFIGQSKCSRNQMILATKFGVRKSNKGNIFYDNSPGWIGQALEESLKRLKVNYIDLYQMHYHDGRTPLEEIFGVLENLRDRGLIRKYGVSNISLFSEILRHKSAFGGLMTNQMEYSLVNRVNEQGVRACYDGGIFSIIYGVLGQGILSGKYGRSLVLGENDSRRLKKYVNFHGEKLNKNLELVDRLRRFGLLYQKTPVQMAFRFVLDHLPSVVALVGVKTREQLEEVLSGVSGEKIDWTEFN